MLMREVIRKVAVRLLLALYRRNEVARFEGIILADLGKSLHFQNTLLEALQLLKSSDSRRFRRVQRYLIRVVNWHLDRGGADYEHSTRSCRINFNDARALADRSYYVGWCACALIHEATHALLESRAIAYLPASRFRIERLCVTEEHRFLLKLTFSQPSLADRLYEEFDFARWEYGWSASQTEELRAVFKRASGHRL